MFDNDNPRTDIRVIASCPAPLIDNAVPPMAQYLVNPDNIGHGIVSRNLLLSLLSVEEVSPDFVRIALI